MQSPFDQSSTDQSPADQSPANPHICPDQHPHDDLDVTGLTTEEIQDNGSPLRLTSQEHYVVCCTGEQQEAAVFDVHWAL
jgi:hypothetical protein